MVQMFPLSSGNLQFPWVRELVEGDSSRAAGILKRTSDSDNTGFTSTYLVSNASTTAVVRGVGSFIPSVGVASSYDVFIEVVREWPEIIRIFVKLGQGEELDDSDKLWIEELVEVTGWDRDMVIEEIRNLFTDPSERAERYKELFEKYYEEALKSKREGNTRQAGEKIWGVVLALIKFYAAIKGIPVQHWGRGKIERFITNNVEREFKNDFRNLLDKAFILHIHFYEGDLDEKTFEERWEEVMEYIGKVKEIVYKRYLSHLTVKSQDSTNIT